MRYLLDAYNLQYAGQALGGAFTGLTIRGLCQWIVASPRRLSATLILDGRAKPDEPSESEFPDVTLLYSGAGVKADTVIAQLVECSGSRKKLTIVTNDRAVALHARRHFANAISCEAFLDLLIDAPARATNGVLPARKISGSPTSGETDHWLKEFGITPPPPKPAAPPMPSPLDEFGEIDMDKLMGGGTE